MPVVVRRRVLKALDILEEVKDEQFAVVVAHAYLGQEPGKTATAEELAEVYSSVRIDLLARISMFRLLLLGQATASLDVDGHVVYALKHNPSPPETKEEPCSTKTP